MIDLINITFKDFLNPEFYISNGGLLLILFIVFAETGLLVGFFLPGDSLLFVAGIYSNKLTKSFVPGGFGSDFIDLIILIILISAAAVLGSIVGYWFGKKSGPVLFERKDSFFFKRKHLLQAKVFFDKHGGLAILFARFFPIIRTFSTVVAGIVQMEKNKFMLYNLIGAATWSFTLIIAGHYLDMFFIKEYGIDLKNHLEIIIIFIVVVTTIPVLYKFISSKRLIT